MMQRWCVATAIGLAAFPALAQSPGKQPPITAENADVDVFHTLDVNNDDVITKDEYAAEWHAAHYPAEKLIEMFAQEDRDSNGEITWAEFLGPKGNIFGRLDTNRDNKLTLDEFDAEMLGRRLEDIRRLFSLDDTDGNGIVTWTEFGGAKLRPIVPNFFLMLDTDHDQALSLEEFSAKWHNTMLKHATDVRTPGAKFSIDEVFRDMDKNSDHVVSFDEFDGAKDDKNAQLMQRKKHAQRLAELFFNLDTNQDKRISNAEYVLYLAIDHIQRFV